MEIGTDEAATLEAIVACAVPRIKIVSEHRRSHDVGLRAQVLAEAQRPGVRVRDVARRHEICTGLIYRWRREAAGVVGAGPPARLVPVRVTPRASTDKQVSGASGAPAHPGTTGSTSSCPTGSGYA